MRSLCAYPDQWYEDCVSSYANCETLVEAVHRNNRNIASVFMDSNGAVLSSDLTLCNAICPGKVSGLK